MATRIVPYTARVVVMGDHEGDKRETTLHYRYSSAYVPVTLDMSTLADRVRTTVLPRLQACVTGQTVWTDIKAVDIGRVGGAQYDLALSPPVVGSRGGGAAPGDVQACLVKEAAIAGRGHNGRTFVMDLAQNDVTDAIIQNGLPALLALLATAIQTTFVTALTNFVPVIPSYLHTNFYLIAGVVFDLLTDNLRTRLKNKRRHKRHP